MSRYEAESDSARWWFWMLLLGKYSNDCFSARCVTLCDVTTQSDLLLTVRSHLARRQVACTERQNVIIATSCQLRHLVHNKAQRSSQGKQVDMALTVYTWYYCVHRELLRTSCIISVKVGSWLLHHVVTLYLIPG